MHEETRPTRHVHASGTDPDHGHSDGHGHCVDCGHALTRRTVLATGAGGVAVALAGCTSFGGGGGSAPEPIALDAGQACDNCGMVIQNHPGPVGQVFFEDNAPEGHENPAYFDALKQCMFPYRLERENRGWSVAAQYVTDYSSVDYDVSTEGGDTYVSSHVGAAAFAPAEELYYVVESEVKGAMGPDFVPFSAEADATAFAEEYGGDVVEYGDIGEGLIGK
jgi:nitrous oxide reductase accessory protein NosL